MLRFKKKRVLYVAFNRVEMMNREIKKNVGLFSIVFRERERESQFEWMREFAPWIRHTSNYRISWRRFVRQMGNTLHRFRNWICRWPEVSTRPARWSRRWLWSTASPRSFHPHYTHTRTHIIFLLFRLCLLFSSRGCSVIWLQQQQQQQTHKKYRYNRHINYRWENKKHFDVCVWLPIR